MTVWREFSHIYPMHRNSYANERWRDIFRPFEPVFKRYEMYITYLHTRIHVTLDTLQGFIYLFGSCMLCPDNGSSETQTQM